MKPNDIPPPPSNAEELRAAVQRQGSFLHSMKAVAWSFFGIRRGADYQNDVSKLNPVHVIVAGLISAALFVGVLVMVVRWVVAG
jgi:hypothetical protein